MDRTFQYPSALVQDTDFLNINRNVLIAIGYALQSVFGTNTATFGLLCTPASGQCTIGSGGIMQYVEADGFAYGSLGTDANLVMKMGLIQVPVVLSTPQPGTAGQSINYLIETNIGQSDTGSIVLPYYNAANPSLPYSGPSNSGSANYTIRSDTVILQVKAGTAAATGTQTTPSADSNFAPLWIVTQTYGGTYSVAQHPSSPFVPHTLPALSPGVRNQYVLSGATGTWTVPLGVTVVEMELWGGGGAGGNGGSATYPGGGGGGGGYLRGFFSVTPGAALTLTATGTTTVSGYCSAAGGSAGATGTSSGGVGGAGGSTTIIGNSLGSVLQLTGGAGGNSYNIATSGVVSGQGGGSFGFSGGYGAGANYGGSGLGNVGSGPGAGGSGGIGTFPGGGGGASLIVIRW